MYIPRSSWKRWSRDYEGGWTYKDAIFECKIDDNGGNDNFSWYVDAKGPNDRYPLPKASGHSIKTFEAAEAAVDAIVNFLLDTELGDYAKQLAHMPKCPHCKEQVGYACRGAEAVIQTTQKEVDITCGLGGSHITKIQSAGPDDFSAAKIIGVPKRVWCLACKKDITDEEFIEKIPFAKKEE